MSKIDAMDNARLPSIKQISGGVIVYTRQDGQIKILLLEQNNVRYKRTKKNARKKVIDIGPSGRVEGSETVFEAALRELKQETNLDLDVSEDYTDSYSYVFEGVAYEGEHKGEKAKIVKTRTYYLASASEEQLKSLKLSDEHISYRFATLDEAIHSKEIMKPQKGLLKRLKERFDAQGN
jgi:8-oxo-dGTP pyrophosphatase MutT (NUDIX family)